MQSHIRCPRTFILFFNASAAVYLFHAQASLNLKAWLNGDVYKRQPLYVEASHGHDCSGTACPVCLTVSVIGSCLHYVLPALLPLLLSLSVPAESVGSRALPASLARLTLIGLKVRLDN